MGVNDIAIDPTDNSTLYISCTYSYTGVSPKINGRIGINSNEATFTCYDYFNSLTSTYYPASFIKLNKAVHAVSTIPDGRTFMTKCSTNCYKGFYFLQAANPRIVDNTFTIKDDLFEYTSSSYPYGLYMDATPSFDIEHNTYTGTKNSAWITGGHGGLVIRDAGPNATQFYRSVFDNLTVASEALNENKSDESPRGLTFRCNDYEGDIKDLQVLKETDVDFSSLTGMANEQGSLLMPADNLFWNASPISLNLDNQANKITYFHQDEFNGSVNTRTKPSLINNVGLTNTDEITSICLNKLSKNGTGWPSTQRGDLATYKTVMLTKNMAWKAIIDNGNSPTNVVEDIETATTGNATSIYNQLMGISPWLSMEALGALAIKELAFTDLQIRNILIANPQAGRSGWIRDILLNRSTPMSSFYIGDIEANADSLTDRDTMAWQVADINTNYDLLLNDLVGWYLDDTLNRLSTLDSLLTHPYYPMYRYQLAGMYFERDMYEIYQDVLDNITTQMDLTDKETEYHTTFNELYDVIKEWKLDSVPLPLLETTQLEWLQVFYEEHPNMPGIGHALLAINDTGYVTTDPVYITDTTAYEGGEPFRTNTNKLVEEKESKLLKVYPNPTNKIITLEWNNTGKFNTALTVKITDQTGKLVVEKEWAKNQNTIKLDLGSYPSGIYYCNVISEGKAIETHKILLTK